MTAMQRSLVGIAAAVALSAAVWAVITGASSNANPVPAGGRPVAVHSIVLDDRSGGSSVTAARGALVIVHLGRGRAMRWSVVAVSQSHQVLTRQSSSRSPGGVSNAVFVASGSGTASLTAAGSPICARGVPCPQYVVLWRVTVVVEGGSST
jgi:hypothetical protein